MVFKVCVRRAYREKKFPYHPNFGITKEEYEFIDKMQLMQSNIG